MTFSTNLIYLLDINPYSDKINAISVNYSKIDLGLMSPSSNNILSILDYEVIKNS